MSTLRNATDAAEGSDNYHDQVGTNGAAHVVDAYASGQNRGRLATAVAGTVKSLTWDDPVREIRVTAFQEAAGTAELKATVAVCFGATSDAVAAAWLTYAESLVADVDILIVPVGESRTKRLRTGVTRADLKRIFGSENIGVYVEAVA